MKGKTKVVSVKLTPQQQIVAGLSQGLTVSQIADNLHVKRGSVGKQLNRLKKQLGAQTIQQTLMIVSKEK